MSIFFYNVLAPIVVGFIAGAAANKGWHLLDDKDDIRKH